MEETRRSGEETGWISRRKEERGGGEEDEWRREEDEMRRRKSRQLYMVHSQCHHMSQGPIRTRWLSVCVCVCVCVCRCFGDACVSATHTLYLDKVGIVIICVLIGGFQRQLYPSVVN